MTATRRPAQRAGAPAASAAPPGTSIATIRYWAGARQAAGQAEETTQATSIGELRLKLAGKPQLAAIAKVAAFLLDGQQADDSTPIPAGAIIDVLPPFAGG